MTAPRIRPCPKCGNADMGLYGYGDYPPLDWHVECDACLYRGGAGFAAAAEAMRFRV